MFVMSNTSKVVPDFPDGNCPGEEDRQATQGAECASQDPATQGVSSATRGSLPKSQTKVTVAFKLQLKPSRGRKGAMHHPTKI